MQAVDAPNCSIYCDGSCNAPGNRGCADFLILYENYFGWSSTQSSIQSDTSYLQDTAVADYPNFTVTSAVMIDSDLTSSSIIIAAENPEQLVLVLEYLPDEGLLV